MNKNMPVNLLSELVESRISSLKDQPFEELSKLSACQSENINRGRKKFIISVWKDELNDMEIRIVVQVYRRLFLGIGRMAADGFLIEKNGTLTNLSREELYEFS